MICRKTIQTFVFLMILFCTCPVSAYSPNQILGDASEGLMQDYFEAGGWKSLPGQVGTKGMDGLFVKYDETGNIRCWWQKANTTHQDLGRIWYAASARCPTPDSVQIDDSSGNSDQKNNPETGENTNRSEIMCAMTIIAAFYESNAQTANCTSVWNRSKAGARKLNCKNLRGEANKKIQYQGNQSIDLKIPQILSKRIAHCWLSASGKSMIRQGMPEPEISRLLSEFRRNPAVFDTP
ncbi:MAG: hypothetical protein R2941_19120 [Desulfobacterales bacterium]